jgi:aminoglycoside 3'-phosphotransferase-2
MPGETRDRIALLERLRTEWQLGAVVPVEAGMSDAAVFRVGTDRFLKLAEDRPSAAALREEIKRTMWLADHGLRVPATIGFHHDGDSLAWLTKAVPGTSAADSTLPPFELMRLFGRALRALHALPVTACPFDETIQARLAVAQRDIDAGAVDPDQFDDRNAGVSPQQLLHRLTQNPPPEDLVVAHGDATLSNMLIGPDYTIGFVDCGRAGRADRYLDLAVMADSIAEIHGEQWRASFAKAYGETAWQADKALYFSDLYELF